jgi:sulfatase maturation enzyme AslB (radical SAM superfamily)
MSVNIILHITTSCNYDCSYCDVIKDKRNISLESRDFVIDFIAKNKGSIGRFKFFWWEPLLAFKDMKYIIDQSQGDIGENYEIVTNTTLLSDEVWEYFEKHFKLIFFSIDTENKFDYEKVEKFIHKYNLEKRLYFNLVISPESVDESLEQFQNLYKRWLKWFNILPVYFTKVWGKEHLHKLAEAMKHILDISLEDKELRLYGFQENAGYDTSLANNTFFIDVDGKIYYSDMVSTYFWKSIKNDLYLGKIWDTTHTFFEKKDFKKEIWLINGLEENIYTKVKGQKELHKIMDYFSEYLNKALIPTLYHWEKGNREKNK